MRITKDPDDLTSWDHEQIDKMAQDMWDNAKEIRCSGFKSEKDMMAAWRRWAQELYCAGFASPSELFGENDSS